MNELWRAFSLRAIRGSLIWNFLWTLVALTVGYIVMHVGLERRMTDYVAQNLKEDLRFIARPFKLTTTEQLVSWCQSIPRAEGKRFTVIAFDGKVLCDNYADTESIVNHADRPEFLLTLQNGIATSTRPSSTSEMTMVYASVKLNDSQRQEPIVLRIALPQGDLSYHLGKMRLLVVQNLLAVLLVLTSIFIWASVRVGLPLRALDRKLSMFKKLSDDKDGIVPDARNEWEKVDLTVDQIYRDLLRKIDTIDSSNEKIATIVESIADGLLAVGSDERIILANTPFSRAFAKNVTTPLNGKQMLDVIRDVDIRRAFKTVMSSKQAVIEHITQEDMSFELRVYPLFQGKDQILGAVGVFHDVTQTQRLQQMREDFVANVSHEVRTPLTAIKGFAQILTSLGPEDAGEFKLYANKIEHNVNRLANLFQDILSLSVLESRERVIKEDVSAVDIIQVTASNVRQSHPEKQVNFKTELKLENLWVEPRLFEQVLTNLLDNAFKYGPNGSCVLVKAYREAEFDIIEVCDDGIGIPKESLARVFERFYRVDASRSREIGGTGLGLAIVKHAVSKHGGVVKVESEVGKGSKFIVKLPSKS